MPKPKNTRDQDRDVAPLVKQLASAGLKVERAVDAQRSARSERRRIALAAVKAGLSLERIAAIGRYGTRQAAQKDLAKKEEK